MPQQRFDPQSCGTRGKLTGGDYENTNEDKKLTMAELSGYVSSKVKEDAAIKGREQTPELQCSGNRIDQIDLT